MGKGVCLYKQEMYIEDSRTIVSIGNYLNIYDGDEKEGAWGGVF